MLRSALARHPRAICLAEMFNPHWNRNAPFGDDTPSRTLLKDYVWTASPPGIDAVGFTIHRRGAPLGDRLDAFEVLASDPDLYVIHLRRENLLRRYLSFRIMKEDKKGPETAKAMTTEELRREFDQWASDYQVALARFSHCPSIEVSYESLCKKPHATLASVQTFLGLPQRRLSPATRPNRPRDLRKLIINFDKLAASFVDTPWYNQFAEGPKLSANARGEVEL
ncbi:MAG: sulfotransferase [Pseudomonadota bacterium]